MILASAQKREYALPSFVCQQFFFVRSSFSKRTSEAEPVSIPRFAAQGLDCSCMLHPEQPVNNFFSQNIRFALPHLRRCRDDLVTKRRRRVMLHTPLSVNSFFLFISFFLYLTFVIFFSLSPHENKHLQKKLVTLFFLSLQMKTGKRKRERQALTSSPGKEISACSRMPLETCNHVFTCLQSGVTTLLVQNFEIRKKHSLAVKRTIFTDPRVHTLRG